MNIVVPYQQICKLHKYEPKYKNIFTILFGDIP